nr:MAG TPA: hypothetical protein [Caudoviricetes sp.]
MSTINIILYWSVLQYLLTMGDSYYFYPIILHYI